MTDANPILFVATVVLFTWVSACRAACVMPPKAVFDLDSTWDRDCPIWRAFGVTPSFRSIAISPRTFADMGRGSKQG